MFAKFFELPRLRQFVSAKWFAQKQREAEKPVAFMTYTVWPNPVLGSGLEYQLDLIRIFQQLGYEVHHHAVQDCADTIFDDPTHYANVLRKSGVRCLTDKDISPIEDYFQRLGNRLEVALLSMHHCAKPFVDPIRAHCPKARIIFNTVDLHHLREQRQGEIENNSEMIQKAQETKRSEIELILQSDATLVVSKFEQSYLSDLGFSSVHFPIMQQTREKPLPDFKVRSGLVFLGEPSHAPNRDGVLFFLNEVWPRVRASSPEMTVTICGAEWPALLSEQDHVGLKLPGRVSDIEGLFDRAKLNIAPLRFGAGTKGKIVAGMRNGVPCVASSVGAEGMGLTNGYDIAIADTPEQYAREIQKLYESEALWLEMSARSVETQRKHFSFSSGVELMREVLATPRTSKAA
jgi:glycosyltransferase involved in cell wall biosynthesis